MKQDNNGFITSCELAQMMEDLGQRLTAEQVQEMIKEADIDNDGKISFEEFRNVMKTWQSSKTWSYPTKLFKIIMKL